MMWFILLVNSLYAGVSAFFVNAARNRYREYGDTADRSWMYVFGVALGMNLACAIDSALKLGAWEMGWLLAFVANLAMIPFSAYNIHSSLKERKRFESRLFYVFAAIHAIFCGLAIASLILLCAIR